MSDVELGGAAGPAPARALVVGVNEYDRSPPIRNLAGCVPDALAMVALLRERFGLDAERIRLLTSPRIAGAAARATRAAIIEGFRDFLAAAPEGEEVLFYYSGHGSTTSLDPADFGMEKGETLVPADARMGEALDLLDRELRVLIAELLEKGLRLTLIIDACHAGDVARSGDDQVDNDLPVARLTGTTFSRRNLASLLDGGVSDERLRLLYDAPLPGYTLVAAARASQQSFEIPVTLEGTRVKRGALTLALEAFLRANQHPISYRELVSVLRARLDPVAVNLAQQPTHGGDPSRALFADSAPNRAPLFVVRAVEPERRRLTIDAGRLRGLLPGSRLRAYTDWSLGEPLGEIVVREARGDEAVAEAGGEWSLPTPGTPLELVERAGMPSIRFEFGTEPVAELWREQVASAAEVADHDARPLWHLVEAEGDDADYTLRRDGEDWALYRADGSEVAGTRNPRANRRSPYRIASTLDRVACLERLAVAEPEPGERYDGPGIEVEWVYADGTVSATIVNRDRRSLFVNLFLLDPERHYARRLWPTDGSEELQPGAISERVEYALPEAGQRQLKWFAGTRELDLPVEPCGALEVVRFGSRGLRFADPAATTATDAWATGRFYLDGRAEG